MLAFSTAAFAQETAPSWTDKVSVNGDIRFRHEYISKVRQADTANAHKEKMRVRLNVNGKVNDKITGKVRIATADGGNSISNNTTMTGNGTKKAVFLDIAAIDWKMCEKTNVILGKQENPLRLIPRSEILYDTDYTPEGISVSVHENLIVRVGSFVVQEREPQAASGTSEPDSWLMAGVVAYKFDLSPETGGTFGIGYHNFTAMKKNSAVGAGFLGNSNSGARYVHDYQVGEVLLELRRKMSGMNLSVYSEYIQNFAAEEGHTGILGGAQLQTLDDQSKPEWTFNYYYVTTGKDATLSAANNSDMNNGEDGGIGHALSVGRTVAANTTASLTWFRGKVDNSGNPFWIDRAMADIVVNF